jgi:hypothetical protein
MTDMGYLLQEVDCTAKKVGGMKVGRESGSLPIGKLSDSFSDFPPYNILRFV